MLQDYSKGFIPTLDVTGYIYNNISTSAQHTIKTGGGILGGVMINTTLTSAMKFYDNTVSGNPTICTIPAATAAGTFYQYRTRFNSGLIVSSGAAADDATVMYL